MYCTVLYVYTIAERRVFPGCFPPSLVPYCKSFPRAAYFTVYTVRNVLTDFAVFDAIAKFYMMQSFVK